MMPAELKSLYRCLLARSDEVISCSQENPNEYHIMIKSNVVHTVGPLKGYTRDQLIFVQLNPILTGEGWNNKSSK